MGHRRVDGERPHDQGFPEPESDFRPDVAHALRLESHQVGPTKLVRRSLDARRARRLPTWQLTLEADLPEVAGTRPVPPSLPPLRSRPAPTDWGPIAVVGAGPAGLFAALHLAEHGARVVLVDRGKAVEQRSRDFGKFRGRGELDPESNLCFGEGGAGTYSDGKLTCRRKDPRRSEVLRRLVELGGPSRILVDAKPHVGTNLLYRILKQVRARLIELGVEIRYGTRMTGLSRTGNRVRGLELIPGGVLDCEAVIVATGHSARDVFELLLAQGARMEAKPFAVGVRIEHPQSLVDEAQYRLRGARPPTLPPADYRLAHTTDSGRGIYSFCMCPGGMIVPTATEPETVVVNGMSSAKRGSPYANSGLVVQVEPGDLEAGGWGRDPLAGVRFQRQLERAAFRMGGGTYHAPAARADQFAQRRSGGALASSNFRPGLVGSDLDELLPPFVADGLRQGLRRFDRQLRGYASSEANLIAIESRTSSPVAVQRDPERFEATGLPGLFVAGEGPGHAGGIMSAALDGLRVADALLNHGPSR